GGGEDELRGGGETAGARGELGRSAAVLGHALVALALLLVRVDVERQRLAGGVAPDLLEPVRRAGAHGVRSEPDADARAPERLELREVLGYRALSHTLEATTPVRSEQQHELDAGVARRHGRGTGLVEAEVVELPDC